MKTLGILGGSSDVATVEYYKLINAGIKARLGGHQTAEIIINSMNFGEVERLVSGDLWEEGQDYVNRHAKALERGTCFVWPMSSPAENLFLGRLKIFLLYCCVIHDLHLLNARTVRAAF